MSRFLRVSSLGLKNQGTPAYEHITNTTYRGGFQGPWSNYWGRSWACVEPCWVVSIFELFLKINCICSRPMLKPSTQRYRGMIKWYYFFTKHLHIYNIWFAVFFFISYRGFVILSLLEYRYFPLSWYETFITLLSLVILLGTRYVV